MKTLFLITLLGLIGCGKQITSKNEASTFSLTPDHEKLTAEDSLMKAVEVNDVTTAYGLARKGLNLDLVMKLSGHTLLTFSLENNFYPMAEMLLEHGARGNRFDDRGVHPLFVAIEGGDLNIVKALMMNGASANIQYSTFSTPLIHAVKNKRSDIAYHLLDMGADNSVLDSNGRNAFDYAQELGLENLALSLYLRSNHLNDLENYDLLLSLLDQGQVRNVAEIVTKTPSLLSRLMNPGPVSMAAKMKSEAKSLEVIKLFVDLGEDVNGRNQDDIHPLAIAASQGRVNTMDYLLSKGADLMRLDPRGDSALIYAVKNRQVSSVKFLLSKDASKKYEFEFENESIKIKACDVALEVRSASANAEEKSKSEQVMWELGCGLRWLLSW